MKYLTTYMWVWKQRIQSSAPAFSNALFKRDAQITGISTLTPSVFQYTEESSHKILSSYIIFFVFLNNQTEQNIR